MIVGQIARGTSARFQVQILDAAGDPVTYSASDTPSAQIWAGDDRAAIASISCAWNGTDYSNVVVTFLAADTTNQEPGVYPIRVLVTTLANPTQPILVFQGEIEITPSPGSATAAPIYGTYDDVLTYWPAAVGLQLGAVDQAQLREVMGKAREILDDLIWWRYNPQPGFQRRRGTTYNGVHGFDVQDVSTAPISKATLRTLLDTNKMTVDATVKEMAARLAIALLLERPKAFLTSTTTTVPKPDENPYLAESKTQNDKVLNLFAQWQAELDTNADDDPDLLIARDCVFLEGYP